MAEQLYRYAIIGTGLPSNVPGNTGFAMAYAHYPHFIATGRTELVAIADTNTAASAHFLEHYSDPAKTYLDYHEMLREEKPEILSICTWPHLHADMAVAAAEAGVKAIHCEKPMATTWGDCKRMKSAADANGVLLSFNHQRRHIKLFQEVVNQVRSGAVGQLVMLEAEVGDMFDWGTHWLDMMQYYNDETPIEWVIGQVDSHTPRTIFGAFMENSAISHFKWTNGVRGVLIVGEEAKIGCVHRIIGTKGIIEVTSERKYRTLGNGVGDWKEIEIPQGEKSDLALAMADVVRQLDEPGYVSLLNVNHVIQHTEIIFATYESSRRRGRVTFPLDVDDNALVDLFCKN